MNNKIGVVILSRFSSSRLPGKALMQINDKCILQYIIERILPVIAKENIIIATSVEPSDDPIANFAIKTGVDCYRGSLEFVAQRFYEAANSKKWDYAIRINGDNIFLDTNVLAEMVNISNEYDYDFISNVKNRTFPKGMSIEIVKLKYFKSILKDISLEEKYKEHVTLYLYENEDNVKHYYFNNTIEPLAGNLQFALDTQEDFERTKKIIGRFVRPHVYYNLKQLFDIYQRLD